MMSNLKVYPTPKETAAAFAEFLFNDIESSQDERYAIALSGGSTPKLLFEILAAQYKNKIDWKRVHFFWCDERMVPDSSPESNAGEAKRILLKNVPVPKKNIHAIEGTNLPDIETLRYAEEILENVPIKNNLPHFHLILLGMGDDGHTASIFPNQMYLLNSGQVCASSFHPESHQERITLTGRPLNNAKKVVFLVTGEQKAGKVSEIIHNEVNAESYPAAYIQPFEGELSWFLDDEAAYLIKNPPS